MKPGKYYRGPIEEINPTYGSPYRIKDHCPNCGSTDLKKVKVGQEPNKKVFFTAPERNKIGFLKCMECGLEFRLPEYPGRSLNGSARYKLKGQMSDDEDAVYSRSEIKDAAYHTIMDHRDHHAVTETAGKIYEDYYYGEDPDGGDMDGEWMSDLEGDAPWVEADDMSYRGYIDHMEVGQSYNFPDFPLTVERVANRKSQARKNSPRNTATKKVVNKTPAKKTAAKPKMTKKTARGKRRCPGTSL